jgi:hypothetical protein
VNNTVPLTRCWQAQLRVVQRNLARVNTVLSRSFVYFCCVALPYLVFRFTDFQMTVPTTTLFLTHARTFKHYSLIFAGIVPNVIGIIPEKAIKLGMNDFLRDLWADPDGTVSLQTGMAAGAMAGAAAVAHSPVTSMSCLWVHAPLPVRAAGSGG